MFYSKFFVTFPAPGSGFGSAFSIWTRIRNYESQINAGPDSNYVKLYLLPRPSCKRLISLLNKLLITPLLARLVCYLVIKCSEAREHTAVSAAAQPHHLPGCSAGCGSVQDPCQVEVQLCVTSTQLNCKGVNLFGEDLLLLIGLNFKNEIRRFDLSINGSLVFKFTLSLKRKIPKT